MASSLGFMGVRAAARTGCAYTNELARTGPDSYECASRGAVEAIEELANVIRARSAAVMAHAGLVVTAPADR